MERIFSVGRPTTNVEDAYHYVECGLDNVWLDGLNVAVDDSGEQVITIPNANGLHHEIARSICFDQEGLSGAELRFLRTEMGMTQQALADAVKSTNVSVSRWETAASGIDASTIALIKLIAIDQLKLGKLNKFLKLTVSGQEIPQAGNFIVNAHDTSNYRCSVEPLAA